MLFFLLFAYLSSSFIIKKESFQKELNFKSKKSFSVNLNKVSFRKSKLFNQDDPQCDYSGSSIDTTTIDISGCTSSSLKDLDFKTKSDGSLIKIENLDSVTFKECKFTSGSEISQSILINIINTDTEIDTFDFDFKNLGEDQYLTSPILSFTGDKSSYDAILTFSVSDVKFKNTEESNGGILKSVNYNIDIDESMFSTINVSENSHDVYIVNFDQSDFSKNITFSIENSIFIEISTSKFIINSKSEFSIEECEFEGFLGPIFSILCDTSTFKKCKFSNKNQNGFVINSTEWTSQTNFFDNCTFEEINGVAILIGSGENYFDQCYFLNNQNKQDEKASSIHAFGSTSLYIMSSHFIGNSGTINGGSLYINANDVEVVECTFENNICNDLIGDVNSSFSKGGALFIEKVSSISLSNCHFTANKASMAGGAIYIEYSQSPFDVKFSDCYFIDCGSSSAGGAVMILGGSSFFNDCYFMNCKAMSGGAIYCKNETVSSSDDDETNITNCIFEHCSGFYGGCVFSCSQKFVLYKCVFEENKDDFSYDGNLSSSYSIRQYTHSFLCLNIEGSSSDPIISDCIFSQNELHVIDIDVSSTLRMTNCLFDNYSNNNLLELSYIVSRGTDEGNIFSGCVFQNCGRKAVYGDKHNHTFINCTFQNNVNKDYYGPGGLQIHDRGQFSIFDSKFINNTGNSNGGALIVDSENIRELDNLTFINNSVVRDESKGHKAQDFGGALYVAQNFFPTEIKIITIRNCYFESNHAMVCGGGIYANFVDVTNSTDPYYNIPIIIENCTFISCWTTYKGGGIGSGMAYDIEQPGWVNGDIVINECYFEGCYAKYGGGIFSHDGTRIGDEETNITKCIFNHCSSDFGGCVYSRSYKFIMKDSVFEKNIDDYVYDGNETKPDPYDPDYYGYTTKSFLYLNMDEEEIDPVIENCTFRQNELHIIDINISGTLHMTNCLFDNYSNNHLLELSYIVSHGTDEGSIYSGCTFQNCGTKAIFGRYYMHTFINCTFLNNTNTEYWGSGGMQVFDQGKFSIFDCLFMNNIGNSNGGALIVDSENIVELNNLTFINNSIVRDEEKGDQSQDFGGALYVAQNYFPTEIKIITIRNCYFENNYAQVCGGGIYCNFVDVTNSTDPYYDIPIVIKNCTFVDCYTTYKGGGVGSGMSRYVNGTAWLNGDIVINDCFFKGCHSQYGGGVFSHDGTEIGDEETNITNCIFDHCYSELGNCIYSRSYLNAFYNCTFQNCTDNEGNNTIILFIEMDEKLVSPTITDCHFINNHNQQYHFVSEHSLKFLCCTFEHLSNDNDGGAILINKNWKSTDLEFCNCTFSNDKSINGNGGAISYSKDESRVPHIAFNECIFNELSSVNGGALFISSSKSSQLKTIRDDESYDIIINGSAFSGCHSTQSGGAIYAKLSSKISIENCFFHSTKSDADGNSVFVDLKGKLKLANIAITKEVKGKPEIYVSGDDSNGLLEIDGGCFQAAKKESGDNSPDFLYFDSAANLKFSSNSCFSGSQEESIYISKQIDDIDSSIFNCDTCHYPPLPPFTPITETPQPYTATETKQPITETLQPETETQQRDTETLHPVTETPIPVTETQQPETETSQPITETPLPVTETQQPETETSQPITETPLPVTETQQPETEKTHPETNTPQPVTETSQPETETPHPETDTPLPVTETQQPITETETKPPITETPQPVTDTPHSVTDTQTTEPTQSSFHPTLEPTATPTDSGGGGDDSAGKIKKLSIAVTVMIVLFVLLILAIVIVAIIFFVKRKAMMNPYQNADQLARQFASQSEASSLSKASLDTNKSDNDFDDTDRERDLTNNPYIANRLNPDPFMRDFEENV